MTRAEFHRTSVFRFHVTTFLLHMKLPVFTISLLASFFCAFPLVAQTPDAQPVSETVVNTSDSLESPPDITIPEWSLPDDSILAQALNATPPMRTSFAQKLANSPEELSLIEKWIQNTEIDHPKNLVLKQILLAMPLPISGPHLVELAKKSRAPGIQNDWAKWLRSYPDAYASVLRAWLKLIPHDSAQFLHLLEDYGALKPDDALDVWAQLIGNFPVRDLGQLVSLGLDNPQCEASLLHRILSVWAQLRRDNPDASPDDPAILRLMRTYAQCHSNRTEPEVRQTCAQRRNARAESSKFPGNVRPEDIDTLSEMVDMLFNASLSRRIVAIDFCRGWSLKQSRILKSYESAKNTTEKAHALRVLHDFCDDNQSTRLLNALTDGDETLRLEAASIIADYPQDAPGLDILMPAFNKEIWPETQLKLYQAIVAQSDSAGEIRSLQKDILLDPNRSESMRLAVMDDLVKSDVNAITLDDMAVLIKTEAPIEVIASVSEHLYATQPQSRPKLRTWIQAQQPFTRRFFSTFARFVNIDSSEKDPSAIDLMRNVCTTAMEQENLILPCLNYMTENAQTDEDRELLQKLQQRKNQVDAMMNLEFAL